MPGFFIPTINQGETDPNVMLKQLLNAYIILTEELTYLLNNLDTKNMNEIDGDILVTGTVTAGKIDVQELSAISANLGHITAGLIESIEIYGSYIATNRGAYPRAEMSNTENLFGAYTDANNFIQVESDYQGGPSLNIISNGTIVGRINALPGSMEIDSTKSLTFDVRGILYLLANGLTVPSFGSIVSTNGQNLGVSIDQKATSGISTSLSGMHNHGIPAGAQFKAVDGTVYTWYPADNHSHAQN